MNQAVWPKCHFTGLTVCDMDCTMQSSGLSGLHRRSV